MLKETWKNIEQKETTALNEEKNIECFFFKKGMITLLKIYKLEKTKM